MIRVLLAEDQAMVRGALAALLELEGDIEVVAAGRRAATRCVAAALAAQPGRGAAGHRDARRRRPGARPRAAPARCPPAACSS